MFSTVACAASVTQTCCARLCGYSPESPASPTIRNAAYLKQDALPKEITNLSTFTSYLNKG